MFTNSSMIYVGLDNSSKLRHLGLGRLRNYETHKMEFLPPPQKRYVISERTLSNSIVFERGKLDIIQNILWSDFSEF